MLYHFTFSLRCPPVSKHFTIIKIWWLYLIFILIESLGFLKPGQELECGMEIQCSFNFFLFPLVIQLVNVCISIYILQRNIRAWENYFLCTCIKYTLKSTFREQKSFIYLPKAKGIPFLFEKRFKQKTDSTKIWIVKVWQSGVIHTIRII